MERRVHGPDALVDVVQRLSLARDLPSIQAIVRTAARRLTGADGATFVLRDDGCCFYADEDAIAPLWKGQRFPLESCISGWSMQHRQPVVIPDIYVDDRIPHDAYRPTFVRSLVMVPIRTLDPVGAIGSYWAGHHAATDEEVELLQALANSTAVAMENVAVYQELEQRVADRTAELARANTELAALSFCDELTGLLNRRGFTLLAEQAVRQLRRSGRTGAVVFVDVDGLKSLNDGSGHEAGDALLRLVAAGLRAGTRSSDVVCRLGGDEFAVCLPELDEPLDAVAARLRATVGSAGVDAAGRPPSVSVGALLVEPDETRSLDELLGLADAAMYADKAVRRGLRVAAA